jgi:N-acetylmuramoyl-L-alanine amidase
MTYRERLRRRLVRQAVRANLDAIQGRLPQALRRGRRIRTTLLRAYRLALAPALLFVAIAVLSTGGQEWRGLAARAESLEALSTRLAFSARLPIDAVALPLGVRRVVLDPGHGGADPGAVTSAGDLEKDITLDVARRLRALLLEAGFEVVMTREGDETLSLRERAARANAARSDLFVSIHVNALPSRESCGLETYYLGPTDDPRIETLASHENLGSGYSLADFRQLLEGVYVHLRLRESGQLAAMVQRGLTAYLARTHHPVKDNGVKTAPFLVLVTTDMPGILAELGCLSNDDQAQWLTDGRHRQRLARGLFVGIRAYADARSWRGHKGSV